MLALQLRGSVQERELLHRLHERMGSRGRPDPQALRAGLDILRDADLRGALPGILQPALVIAGGRDRLTPPQASRHLAGAMPHARLAEKGDAAHVPFLSHPDWFMETLTEFMQDGRVRH